MLAETERALECFFRDLVDDKLALVHEFLAVLFRVFKRHANARECHHVFGQIVVQSRRNRVFDFVPVAPPSLLGRDDRSARTIFCRVYQKQDQNLPLSNSGLIHKSKRLHTMLHPIRKRNTPSHVRLDRTKMKVQFFLILDAIFNFNSLMIALLILDILVSNRDSKLKLRFRHVRAVVVIDRSRRDFLVRHAFQMPHATRKMWFLWCQHNIRGLHDDLNRRARFKLILHAILR
mmetsp:Transcript_326/g.621  ORF Transcript_326/g.621 Transcript_326/m.621 type:complete len:233 (+) Transcript_326:83-781(+)